MNLIVLLEALFLSARREVCRSASGVSWHRRKG